MKPRPPVADPYAALSTLQADLAGFADPGTLVTLDNDGPDGSFIAEWTMRGDVRRERFNLPPNGGVTDITVGGSNTPTSYSSFLAGPTMADLTGLARNLLGRLKPITAFVDPVATEDDVESALPGGQRALSLLERVVAPNLSTTNLVFITASAGVGKTSLLTQAVRRRAELYRTGRATSLWFYVDAQGRRLAKLDDAVSGDLGKSRAVFSFDATTALVRAGALVLVVDGFDELLGVAGSYDESYSSLSSYLNDLRGAGCVIAAARSAYYEQEFVARVNSSIGFRSEGWDLKRVRLEAWTNEDRWSYIQRRAEADPNPPDVTEITEKLDRAFDAHNVRELKGRPFFVTETVDLLWSGDQLGTGASFLELLVNSYLAREAEQKLRERPGRSYLNVDQLRALFSEVAEEMWRQDTVELSRASLRELFSVWLDVEGIGPEAQSAVVERGPYSALVVPGEAPGSVRFEHDVYYAYFLAEPIVEMVRSRDDLRLRQALRRGRLPQTAADLAGERLRDDLHGTLDLLARTVRRQDASTEQVRQNAGTVVSGLLRDVQNGVEQLILANFAFVDCSFRDVSLEAVEVNSCTFVDVDLRGSVWRGSGSDVLFERIKVDPSSTVLALTGVPLHAFRAIYEPSQSRAVYEPARIASVLAECGLPSAEVTPRLRNVGPAVVSILERVARIYSRTNIFTETDDTSDVLRLRSFPEWDSVRDAMIRARVLSWDERQASGRKIFLRVHVDPSDIIAGRNPNAQVPKQVIDLWEMLELEAAPSGQGTRPSSQFQ